MLRKEFIQMRRDRLTLAMLVVIPAVQLVLFGYAIRTEVKHLPTVVLDESRSASSRALVAAMANTKNFDIIAHVASRLELDERIARGEARAALIIPPRYATDLKRGRGATAQLVVDAADPMASSAAISAGALVAAAHGAEISAARGRAAPRPLDLRVRPMYNPALRSSAYIVPGIVGILLTMTMLVITSMAVVRERERGTLEQLIVTPIGKTSIMLGKILPFVIVGYVQMTVVVALGKLLFDIPIRGSLVLLYLLTFAFILVMLAMGLFISTVVRTQAQAMQLGFFVMLPSILLSGFMFPREAMPLPAQWLGLALPLTYYLRILRGVLLKGLGVEYLWRDTLALALFATLLVVFSVRRFSKTID
jgi:ABC-2 type transport system permease protein